MIDYLPLIVAAISLIGSAVAFILSSQERKANQALKQASAAHKLGESYKGLIESLETRVDNLEQEIIDQKKLRRAAEKEVEQLSKRVTALELENSQLIAENKLLRDLLD